MLIQQYASYRSDVNLSRAMQIDCNIELELATPPFVHRTVDEQSSQYKLILHNHTLHLEAKGGTHRKLLIITSWAIISIMIY